jgi:hypothetical protein
MLELLTRGISESPVVRAARGATTMQKFAAMHESPAMKVARGETTMQKLAAVNDSPVMRTVRGDATWRRLTQGEPTLLAALRQPSVAQRLNQVFADMQAARVDQALLLARATYEDTLRTAATGRMRVDESSPYEELLRDAEQMVAAAFERVDLDGEAELSDARAAVQADLAEAVAAEPPQFKDGVMVEVSGLEQTNMLLE